MKNPLVPLVGGVLAALLATPGAAFAQTPAVTNGPAYLYAGPAPDYPVVAQLPGSVPVTVMGCVAGYSWCDVAMPGMRGWMYAGSILYPYRGSPVPLLNYGATIGLPIVSFSIGNYWNSYYRDRPWYGNRGRWERHAPPRPLGPPRPPAYGGNYGNHGGGYGGNYGGGNRPQDFRPGPPPGGRPQGPVNDGRHPPRPDEHRPAAGGYAPRPENHAGAEQQRPAGNPGRPAERPAGNAGARQPAPLNSGTPLRQSGGEHRPENKNPHDR